MQTQILQGFTLFGILTQWFFNHYRNNELYIGAKRNSINTFTLTFHPHFVNKVFTESSNIFEKIIEFYTETYIIISNWI